MGEIYQKNNNNKELTRIQAALWAVGKSKHSRYIKRRPEEQSLPNNSVWSTKTQEQSRLLHSWHPLAMLRMTSPQSLDFGAFCGIEKHEAIFLDLNLQWTIKDLSLSVLMWQSVNLGVEGTTVVPEAAGKFTLRNGKICCIFDRDRDTSALWVLRTATTLTVTKGRVPVETLTVRHFWASQVFLKKKKKNKKQRLHLQQQRVMNPRGKASLEPVTQILTKSSTDGP